MDRKEHWENVYNSKLLTEVSWYQPNPSFSFDLIEKYIGDHSEALIDIGGGDSFLVDKLLEAGYSDVSVLDISDKAIERAKERLGSRAERVNFITSDVIDFRPEKKYKVWYDRAALHFLISDEDIHKYLKNLLEGTEPGSIVILGTFSENGPTKCSGITIKQYSHEEMLKTFGAHFEERDFINIDHQTPFDTTQNFNFIVLERK